MEEQNEQNNESKSFDQINQVLAERLLLAEQKAASKEPSPKVIRDTSQENAETKTIMFVMSEERCKPSVETLRPIIKPKIQALRIERIGSKLHLRQPFKILTDIWGVLTSYNFREVLYQYIDDNLKDYLTTHFEDEETKLCLENFVNQNLEIINKYPEMPLIQYDPTCKESCILNILNNINFRKENSDKSLMQGLDPLYNLVWTDGYTTKKLRPHIFPDVIPNLKKWHLEPFYIKIYTFASGPVEKQKLFLSSTTEGDVWEWITSGFDAHHRYKYDTRKYISVISSLSEREPQNLFYLTDSPRKAKAARASGMTVFVVLRNGNRKYKEEDIQSFHTIETFDEFDFYEFT